MPLGSRSDPFSCSRHAVIPAASAGYLLRPPHPVSGADIFLSSGDDVQLQRDFVDLLVTSATEGLGFRWVGEPRPQLRVVRWEDQPAFRAGSHTNAEFVRLATSSHVTIVLLHKELRPGTKEEVEAVLDDGSVQLAVVWLEATDDQVTDDLREFMKHHRDSYYWNTVHRTAWRPMAAVLVRIIAAVVGDLVRMTVQRGDYVEQR